MAYLLGYLGMQDASRKHEDPSQWAGAWSGMVCHTDNDMVNVLCTQDKWDKAHGYISKSCLSSGPLITLCTRT